MPTNKKQPTADPFYASPGWRRIRKLVLIRDGYNCVICHKHMPRMAVDHIKSRKEFPHLCFTLDNLRTLCPVCHARQATSLGRSDTYKERPKIGLDGFPEGWAD